MCASRGTRSRKTRLELDIEKNRAEGNFSKAIDLAYGFKNDQSGLSVCLFNLVYCENKLELAAKNSAFALDLADTKAAADKALQNADDQYRYEAWILKAKIAFVQEDYSEVVQILKNAGLKNAKIESYTSRFSRLLSEGFAMLGISSERIAAKSDPSAISEDEICEYYELAGDICIRHLQELEKSLPENSQPVGIPKAVDMAIKRHVLSSLQHNNVQEPMNRFRALMRYVETPSTKPLRQSLSKQLAELLLRVVCTGNYQKYLISSEIELDKLKNKDYARPQRYSTESYVPDDQLQEAILMLLISEYIASQDVILNRLSEERTKTVNETVAVYDLLAIALVRRGCFTFLSKTLERALKFSFREFQIWFQFALSLISSRKYYRAYLILRECQRIEPDKPTIYLLAASLCLGHLHLVEEGIAFASKGIEVTEKLKETYLCARSHLMLGWGYSISARECRMLQRKNDLQHLAVEEYKAATVLDPDDYNSWYHLGVELAVQRRMEEAFQACQRSILLAPTHSDTIRLLALLHTAASSGGAESGQLRLEQAVRALHTGLADSPHDFSLLFTLAHIEAERNGPQVGILVYMQLLEIWRDNFSTANSTASLAPANSYDNSGFLDRFRGASSQMVTTTVQSDPLSGSATDCVDYGPELPMTDSFVRSGIRCDPHTTLLPSNRLEATLAELVGDGASNRGVGGESGPTTSPTEPSIQETFSPNNLLAKILGSMAELYLKSEMIGDARACIEEAFSYSQMNHELIYLRGRVLEAEGRFEEAQVMYESVIAINPSHVKALFSLAGVLRNGGQYILAEQALRDALAIDSTNSRVWRLLGEVLSSSECCSHDPGSKATATTAFMSAIELEQTEPIEPFYTLRLGVFCN